jgi:hypothetical protein
VHRSPRIAWWTFAVALVVACSSESAAVRTGPLALWEPVDPSFAGCQGACGAHLEGDHEGVVEQPGAVVGDRTYCPVSGAVFEVDADHRHVEIGRRTLWFCCAACAHYFAEHRDEVLAARGIEVDDERRSRR